MALSFLSMVEPRKSDSYGYKPCGQILAYDKGRNRNAEWP